MASQRQAHNRKRQKAILVMAVALLIIVVIAIIGLTTFLKKDSTDFSFVYVGFSLENYLSQSRRLPLLQVVSNNKSFSVGVQSPTEINAPRGCAVIQRRICQLTLTRITHQVSRAFDLNFANIIRIFLENFLALNRYENCLFSEK